MLLYNNSLPSSMYTAGKATNTLWDVFKELFFVEYIYTEAAAGSPRSRSTPGDILSDPSVSDPYVQIFVDAHDIAYNDSRLAERTEYMRFANRTFQNPTALPDGGTMYGIIAHRRRVGVHSLGADVW